MIMNTESSNQNSSKPARKQIRLTWWAAVMVLLLCVLTGVQVVRSELSAYQLGYETGRVLGAVLFAALLGIIAYFVSKRSLLVFNIAFACVIGLALIGKAATLARTPSSSQVKQDKAVFDRLSQQNATSAQSALEKYEKGELANATEQAERTAKSLEDASSQTTDEALKALMALMANIAREIGSAVQPYSASVKKLVDAGGINASTFDTVEAINARIAVLDEMEQVNNTAEQTLRKIVEGFGARVESTGLNKKERENAESGFRQAMGVQIRLRTNQRALIAEMKNFLVLLHDNWDDWGFEENDPVIRFSDEDTLAKHNALAEKIQALSSQEQALMREITELSKRNR